MDKATQQYHAERRRIAQFINAAGLRLTSASTSRDVARMQRAAEDLAQAVDELLELAGGHQLSAPADCPDCGQLIEDGGEL